MLRVLAGLALVSVVLGSGCAPAAEVMRFTTAPMPTVEPPEAPREFRAAWIATVANIDWPSEPGLSADSQRAELRGMLDRAVELSLNAVVFQVRPMADALYPSGLEPWSIYLTGQAGGDPGYDPLALAIEEAHARGLELHAWFNPFRAGHPTHEGAYDSSHVSVTQPAWVHDYGVFKWMDPGIPEVRDHSLSVMLDVVRRYDIDGVHMDDYFYPYAALDSTGAEIPFPDSIAWRASGFNGSLSDWRRSNVDTFVETLYDAVKAVRPEVKVGISPFGIWRPGYPEGVTGFDQYEGLYADARKWLREGWVDYYTPQLYWAMDSQGQPYAALLDWWTGENIHNRHLWPGNYASRVILEGSAYWEPEELVRQVRHTRQVQQATGNVHFSMKALMPGTGQGSLLRDSVYTGPALVPATTWLGGATPDVPIPSWDGDVLLLDPGTTDPAVWHVREWRDTWSIRVVPGAVRRLIFDGTPPTYVVVSAVSPLGLESAPAWAIRRVPVE
ncbi:MAG: family 10 glycosylhydrolase [Rhodothermales bacterium]|nr:family 10 glycosylhydrolase [Rhodothermales bacterium]MBO6780560.1 family 10 glycosylhydrolase [Rhodothermales bacterium]